MNGAEGGYDPRALAANVMNASYMKYLWFKGGGYE